MVSAGQMPSADSADLSDPFEVESILAVAAPNGSTGTHWYRYEISQGPNRIVGYRDGGIDKVTDAVRVMVTQLNERRYHRRGRVHVVLSGPASRA
jgi:hypothetical protein